MPSCVPHSQHVQLTLLPAGDGDSLRGSVLGRNVFIRHVLVLLVLLVPIQYVLHRVTARSARREIYYSTLEESVEYIL